MKYEIFGGNLPAVTIRLEAGEAVYTQSGGMTWRTDGIDMETNMKGGLKKAFGRMFTGESVFMATYTARYDQQEITISSTFPGSILPLYLDGAHQIIAQKSAFLCATPEVELSTHVVRGLRGGLFGGEGFLQQRLSGAGYVFLEVDGSLVEKILAPGERLLVDTGNVVAYEPTVDFSAEMVQGFSNVLFGGEGLFLTTLTGPGRVWLQTIDVRNFAGRLAPYLPKGGNRD